MTIPVDTRPASPADADTIARLTLERGYLASADELRARLTTLLSRETKRLTGR